jgi:hypothetical protein
MLFNLNFMRQTKFILSLGLVSLGFISSSVLAQYPITRASQLPVTKMALIGSPTKQKVDSLQRITQPGYYRTLFTQQKSSTQVTTARLADNSCYSYLCGLTNGEIVTIKLGEWNDPDIWSVNRIPTSADIVRVRHEVIIPASYNAQAKRLRYDAGGKLLPATNSRLQLGL